MNKIMITLLLVAGRFPCQAEITNEEFSLLNQKIEQLKEDSKIRDTQIKRIQSDVKEIKRLQTEISQIYLELSSIEAKSDSIDTNLAGTILNNAAVADANHQKATAQIDAVGMTSQTKIHTLTMWGVWSITILLMLTLILYILLHRGISKGTDAITAIRKAQENLQEESVKLDSKLIELLDSKIKIEQTSVTDNLDHTLALKVADEITRIEINLSRMDQSVKGYKQLAKAVERIKNNFHANGYEIVTYVGQNYNEGMRIYADFVVDEELPEGTRIITSVSKPQVHYKGMLVQKASVTVSQNI
jgi:hypothetical protein